MRGRVSSQAPWASGIIFWSGGWGRRAGVLRRAWGLWEGRGAGEVLAWAPGLAKSANGDVSKALSSGDLGTIFQSVEKYCKKSLQVGPGQGWGVDGRGETPS